MPNPPLPREIRNRIRTIASDKTSGSAELVRRAAGVFRLLAQKKSVRTQVELQLLLEETALALIEAQPVMAPMLNLANRVLLSIDGIRGLKAMKSAAAAASRRFLQDLADHEKSIARHARKLIHNGDRILIYSRSSTVQRALLDAKKAGKRFEVVCPEARPMYEGVTAAKELGEAGIAVTLVTDGAAFSMTSQVHLVFVGADAVTADGIINKIGTSSLARIARQCAVPVYALCGSEKVVPPQYRMGLDDMSSREEILSEEVRNVRVYNQYFDLTPYGFITRVVTERGATVPRSLVREVIRCRLHALIHTRGVPTT